MTSEESFWKKNNQETFHETRPVGFMAGAGSIHSKFHVDDPTWRCNIQFRIRNCKWHICDLRNRQVP